MAACVCVCMVCVCVVWVCAVYVVWEQYVCGMQIVCGVGVYHMCVHGGGGVWMPLCVCVCVCARSVCAVRGGVVCALARCRGEEELGDGQIRL